MTNQIFVQTHSSYKKWAPIVQRACESTLDIQKVEEGSLTVVLVNEETMRHMNLEFGGEDHATDVLSFPSGEIDPDLGSPYFGDLIIAVPIAQKQAQSGNHPLEDELSLLAIHGTLHLLGFDHSDPTQKATMWEAQESVLGVLGINLELREEDR